MPYRPFDRSIVYTLPPALDDWVAADHPVRFVAAFVSALDAATWAALGLPASPPAQGAPAYHPALLLSVWLAGFMQGIRSSRGLEVACRDQLPMRWLSANQQPDHNTLWRFWQAQRAAMHHLLRQTVQVAVQAGLVELAVVAIDGSKVRGAAARERTYDAAQLAALMTRVDAAIADIEAQHQGDDGDSPRLPPALRDPVALRARVADALATVTAPDGPARLNLTDPDAKLLLSRQGWIVGYNAQAAVTPLPADAAGVTGQLITAAEVSQQPDDHGLLLPLLDASRATVGDDPGAALADGGYHDGATLADCRARGQLVVLPEAQQRALTDPYHQQHFSYDAASDTFTCPQGQLASLAGEKTRGGQTLARRYRVGGAICRACLAFGVCTRDARHGRTLEVSPYEADLRRHRDWMATDAAQALARQRQTLPEPVFGCLKEQHGLRRFLRRGLAAVTAEWRLLAVGFNLKVLARYWRQGRLAGVLGG
jgi:transposase